MSFDFLRKRADDWIARGLHSVVHKTDLTASDDPHDYVSLPLYAWPTGDGGYEPRDGYTNPETHGPKFDRVRLREMINTVRTLALAQRLLEDVKYGEGASEALRVWFLNAETYMKPHLLYAQVCPGRKSGGSGIIDAYEFWSMLDAVELLIHDRFLNAAETEGLRSWFGDLTTWLSQDPKGIKEKNTSNNHGTSYDVQVIRYSMFTGDISSATRMLEEAIKGRLENHIMPDGTQPEEARRNKSLHYHWYNLTKMCNLGELGARLGVDFLNHKNLIRRAIEYLLPFVDHPETWPLEQISPVTPINLLEPVYIGMTVFNLPGSRDIWERHFGDRTENLIYPMIPYQALAGGQSVSHSAA